MFSAVRLTGVACVINAMGSDWSELDVIIRAALRSISFKCVRSGITILKMGLALLSK